MRKIHSSTEHQATAIKDFEPPARTGFVGGLRNALLVCALVLFSSWLGIVTRSGDHLAIFWPANALLLGLYVRAPRFATPMGWIAAVLGYIAADFFTGSDSLLKTLLLTSANLASVVSGYWMYSRYDRSTRSLKRARSILIMLGNVVVAGTAAAVLGAFIDPLLFHGTPLRGGSFWFITEVSNYLAILPVFFSAPQLSMRLLERRRYNPAQIDLRYLAPAFALALSCALSVLIGGPAAIAFPIPALLWCSVTYSVFTIALLTLGFSIWSLIAVSTPIIELPIAGSLIEAEMLIRIGVSLLALAPMTLAIAMAARKELLGHLLNIASHDPLTGLLNRHAFRQRCNMLLAQMTIEGRPASLLMIDIDDFKAISDTHGHAAGDLALINFSRMTRKCLRNSDVLGRLGGEEFAVLLPDCLHSEVQIVAERIRRTIAETAIDLDNHLRLSITVSIGAAITHEAPPDIDPLLLAADSALYRAKSAGPNRIVESEFNSAR